MKPNMRSAILFAAVLMISAVTAVNALAQSSDLTDGTTAVDLIDEVRGITMPAPDSGIDEEERYVVEPILMGQEFAPNGDQPNTMDVKAILMGDLSPGFMGSLFSQTKSPKDITKKINDAQMPAGQQPTFAGKAYAVNMNTQSIGGDKLKLIPRGTDKTTISPTAEDDLS